MRSYDAGPTDVPLIEDTIGRNFERTVEAGPDGKLAHYKIPRYVRIVEDFPMTVTGKIRKAEMRTESIEFFGLTA